MSLRQIISAGNTLPIYSLAREELDQLVRDNWVGGDKLSSCRQLFPMIAGRTKNNVWKDLEEPKPLACYTQILDEIALKRDTSGIRYVVSIPPQHGKTLSTLIGLVFIMLKKPGCRCIYITYNTTRASSVQEQFSELLSALGLKHKSSSLKQCVTFSDGSSVRFASISTGVTGYTATTCVIADDLYASFADAQSVTIREDIAEKFTTDVISRSQGGCAFIITNTRAHIDDICGSILNSGRGFKLLNIPALCVDVDNDPIGRTELDTALWASRKSAQFLLMERTADPIQFDAMYQGTPGASGLTYFSLSPSYYTDRQSVSTLPVISAGLDLGYSGKGDSSVYWELSRGKDNKLYISKLIKECTTLEKFAHLVKSHATPGVKVRMYGTSVENEALNIFRSLQISVRFLPANKSKVERAMNTYRSWNGGNIVYPDPTIQTQREREAYKEITQFTGDDRQHDDTIDSLVAAFDEANETPCKPFIMSNEDINRLTWNRENMVGISV